MKFNIGERIVQAKLTFSLITISLFCGMSYYFIHNFYCSVSQ